MAKVKETFPVSKNGKYFGHADADQINSNPALKIFDATEAATKEAVAKVEAAAAEKDKKASDLAAAENKGADPSAVRKAPAK
jgi:hypothetical protein